MFDITDPETFWLNMANISLGVVTLICCVAVAAVIVREVIERLRQPAAAPAIDLDDHAFVVSGLGITMADGGVPISASGPHPGNGEEPNIIRSEN